MILFYVAMENLFLIQCQPSYLSLLQNFSIPYEYTCVELCSYLKKGPEHFYIIATSEIITSSKQIQGFFHFNKSMHICIPFFKDHNDAYKSLFKSFFTSEYFDYINLLVGEKASVDFLSIILNELSITPKHTNSYQIMTLSDDPVYPPEALSADDEIICCTKQNMPELFNLQKYYLIKEVALPKQKITDNEVNLMLSNILKNQLVMAISSGLNDDEFVSKVNTNAIGAKWIQLGGIYTDPFNRRNYYAWHLIYTICKRIQKNNKNPCLFVKNDNTPAISLYKKIGFKIQGEFSILYF